MRTTTPKLTIVIMLLISLGCTYPYASAMREGNRKAMISMRSLVAGEQRFHNEHGRFGTLDELVRGGYAERPYAGYTFELSVDEKAYRLLAKPSQAGETGFSSFFVDETGVIRESWEGVANERSMPAE